MDSEPDRFARPSRFADVSRVMQRPSAHLAVVPAYNEQATISRVVENIQRWAPDFDIVVIDDGSTDDTGTNAAAAGASVVRLPFNCGIGGAVQAGFVYAKENGYDRMVQIDGDGQHDARELHKLIEALDESPGVDVICGSRFLSEDNRYPAPISRRTGIHIFAFLLSRMIGERVSDPTS
ncbi:MAG: glycosyl transferase family 2, partial [Solirubrobacterales bacterium]|nr:glycosyl transferase family 2 [Solirubrobacterales bacterium]